MIECRTRPICRVVANRTIGREPGLHVIGIRRAVIQRDMTRAAIRRCPGEYVIDVALRALHRRMPAR